ncbi:hypothetical protein LPB72_07260 [Hydrogenophaga crassostreae]|uniref:Uncharacterized protein n=2 Tax=Hydrogenophaga crassostreae TaxID=1763535 RepID=A0A167IGB0_9BURK|nr:hypothetical protein LPB072_10110 [Hydrogenophaga crassostreae]OAD42699.1 hypothetical protein LPB72_07260 [Hydrogenophaga crassostreae]
MLPKELLESLMSWPVPACTVVQDTEPKAWNLLLIWLPGVGANTLNQLAQREPYVKNTFSADLLKSRTMLCWETPEGTEVLFDEWLRNADLVDFGRSLGYTVVFLNELTAYKCEHHLGAEEAEAFVYGLQGATCGSGPNYNPWRIWSEDELKEHEGLVDVPDPKVIHLAMLSFKREACTS